MYRQLKSLMLCSCFSAVFLVSADFNKLEAAYGRWGAYEGERGAWGGNAGLWDGNDWYGDSGTPPFQDNYGGHPSYSYSDPSYSYSDHYSPGGYTPNAYYYDNNYPYYGQYYNGPGMDADIDGPGGGYFNVR